jgi:hypothetical protein
MATDNLRTDFEKWMATQKAKTGERFSQNTIKTYSSSLKTSSVKLEDNSFPHDDVFLYTTSAEFEPIYQRIMDNPRLKDIDKANQNGAFSVGLKWYRTFLLKHETPKAWIFQGNPKYYDVVGAVRDLDVISWRTNQYDSMIRKGHRAFIWISGLDGGIIADGTILCDPEDRQPDPNDPYAHGLSYDSKKGKFVDIRIDRKLGEKFISRVTLVEDERTKDLEVLTFPSATNFKVFAREVGVIDTLLDGTYVRIPAIYDSPSDPPQGIRYWIYAPGENARKWEEFFKEGIMGLGWDEMGDFRGFASKASIQQKLRHINSSESSYMNAVLAIWQFSREMKPGDVVFAKKGRDRVIGYGTVESEYIFDPTRTEFTHVRKVNWTSKGDWDHDGFLVQKTLTDVTYYTDYCIQLMRLVGMEGPTQPPTPPERPPYSIEDFLDEVYMGRQRYDTLRALLMHKKNLILQGAPGVGKTFIAKRLAYSILGEMDPNRVMTIQFHQSYSYEDFIMGFRPCKEGFDLVRGPFYEFCKKAEEEEDIPYFFIIDEINRGNLSKIFGELLMLIENDKRGVKARLLYQNEQFSVPKNLYLIGMMNTADRSLALIDYALRRRFAFFELEPAFESDGFRGYLDDLANPKFEALVDTVQGMNRAITQDASLGAGFRIGHSYFCSAATDDIDLWLANLVEFELIPLLQEYWFDEPSKVETWTAQLRVAIA